MKPKIMHPQATPFNPERLARLQPYLTAWGDQGFLERDEDPDLLAVPDTPTMVAIDLDTATFEQHCQFVYTNTKLRGHPSPKTGKLLPDLEIRGSLWWEGGMQAHVVRQVRLVSDDGKEVFVFYDAMNRRHLPQWLGRLVPGFASTGLVLGRMRRFMVEWAK